MLSLLIVLEMMATWKIRWGSRTARAARLVRTPFIRHHSRRSLSAAAPVSTTCATTATANGSGKLIEIIELDVALFVVLKEIVQVLELLIATREVAAEGRFELLRSR